VWPVATRGLNFNLLENFMHNKHVSANSRINWLIALGGLLFMSNAFAVITITVDSTGDQALADPGGGQCISTAGDCTTRAAIQVSNNYPGSAFIDFSSGIPVDAAGFSTISPSSPFPEINGQVIIRGETHPSYDSADNTPRVRINGANLESEANGLVLQGGASGSTIRHLSIYDFMLSGVRVAGVSDVTIRDSYLGLEAVFTSTGSVAGNGGSGVELIGGSSNTVQDNWIGDNGTGISISDGSSQNLIIGNQIGMRPALGGTGFAPAGNTSRGIFVTFNAGSGNLIGQCTITFDPVLIETCIGNTITANGGAGIQLSADGQSLRSNWIGVAPGDIGNPDYGNNSHGIWIEESDDHTVLGGLFSTAHHIIGHNENQGIRILGNGIVISNALVGTTSDGQDLGNGSTGIRVISGDSNVISNSRIAFNRTGIQLHSSYNEVLDNWILENTGGPGIAIANGGQLVQGNVVGNHSSNTGISFFHDVDATADGMVRIYNNHIGVTPEGDPIPNAAGISGGNAGFARIGNDDGRGNVIGFNGRGISLRGTSDARVQANWIGIMPDGSPAGNGTAGIDIRPHPNGELPTNGNRIGYRAQDSIPHEHVGTDQSLGNIIAHNPIGVRVAEHWNHEGQIINNAIRGNRFFANENAAIELDPGGDTVDPGGGETGPNNLQNFPEFDEADTLFNADTGEIEFTYMVNTITANASYPLLVDFYIAGGSSRQGRVFLHTDEYTAFYAAQPKSGSFVPPSGVDLEGAYLVATATDSDGNTSQFSEAILLTDPVDELFQDRFEEAQE
jgi:hypothetical protein